MVLSRWKSFRDDLIEVCTQDHSGKDGKNSRKHNEKGNHFTGIAKANHPAPADPQNINCTSCMPYHTVIFHFVFLLFLLVHTGDKNSTQSAFSSFCGLVVSVNRAIN